MEINSDWKVLENANVNLMNRCRHSLCQEIVQYLANLEGVDAIILGGSVAAGTADEYSDIEIGIYWEILPSIEWLENFIQKTFQVKPIRMSELSSINLTLSPFWYQDYIVDMKHQKTSSVSQTIENLANSSIINHHEQLMLEVIQNCIVFSGFELINNWKSRLIYPDALAQEIINSNLDLLQIDQLLLLSENDCLSLFYSNLAAFHSTILEILLAINKRYTRGDSKWQQKRLSELQLVIKDCNKQIVNHYLVDPLHVFPDIHNFLLQLLELLYTVPLNINIDSFHNKLKMHI